MEIRILLPSESTHEIDSKKQAGGGKVY
jgi:hypothetical protein